MKKIGFIFLLFFFFCPLVTQAAVLKPVYPRLANYFLKWQISDAEARELAKWDLLVLDMEVSKSSLPQLQLIRQLNPKVIILAYLTSEEIIDNINDYNGAAMRQDLNSHLFPGWFLKDAAGRPVSNWPYTSMLNLTDDAPWDANGQRFNDYLPQFVADKIAGTGLWDGVFYDNTWGDVSWINKGDLDFNNDGVAESPAESDQLWASGFKKMLAKTRTLTGNDFIIVGNGRVYYGYQSLLNGMMLEDFPSSWENGGTWSGSMATYFNLANLNQSPQTSIINSLDTNQENYQRVRFTLASALLGDGFYSFDSDTYNHNQTWWYDEYNVNLGTAQSGAYNLLTPSTVIKPGLWRRDFKNGVAIVNSTDITQKFVFAKEDFEKIKGEQAPLINTGERINYLNLAPRDGIILLKRTTVIKNSAFLNGYFYRVFNASGTQVRNSFFSYAGGYPGGSPLIVIPSADNQDQESSLAAVNGRVSFYTNGKATLSFQPYNGLFKNQLSIAAKINTGNLQSIVTGPTLGGGPQVRLFDASGRLRTSFFAYDQKFRGGVSVALGDVDGDGQEEIITAPGPGLEPRIKIFNLAALLKKSFLAYDQKFLKGVNVAVGDVNGDGKMEIITGPNQGGGPQVRVFNDQGIVLDDFFAYDKTFHGGIAVSASDINDDGRIEILVGINNFY